MLAVGSNCLLQVFKIDSFYEPATTKNVKPKIIFLITALKFKRIEEVITDVNGIDFK